MKEVKKLRILIVEDDLSSRTFMRKFLSKYGECDLTVDGIEAVEAFLIAHDMETPYDLICLDIMMPKVDGLKALKAIRDIEKQKKIEGAQKVKVIMATALNDKDIVYESFDKGCEAFAAKPINTNKFIDVMKKLDLIK